MENFPVQLEHATTRIFVHFQFFAAEKNQTLISQTFANYSLARRPRSICTNLSRKTLPNFKSILTLQNMTLQSKGEQLLRDNFTLQFLEAFMPIFRSHLPPFCLLISRSRILRWDFFFFSAWAAGKKRADNILLSEGICVSEYIMWLLKAHFNVWVK